MATKSRANTARKSSPSKAQPKTKAQPKIRPVAPVELGSKRRCPSCGTKFYDFKKAEVVCPKCNSSFRVEELAKIPSLPEIRKKSEPQEGEDDVVLAATNIAADDDEVLENLDEMDSESDDADDIEVEGEEEGEY